MIVPDLNLLIYAVNQDCPEHARARAWLEQTLSGTRPVGLAWVVVLAFLRITTRGDVFERPLTEDEALAYVDGWFSIPVVRPLPATGQHWGVFRSLVRASGAAGNLTTDAHLAALAIEHGARLASADNDFRRFAGLDRFNPLQE